MSSEPEAEAKSKDPEALRAEIAEIRAELGDTVEALAAKADVKAQAHAKVEQTKEQLREKAGQAKAQIGQATGQLKAKTAEQTSQLRGKAEGASQRAPWPQLAAGAAAVAALVLGGRAVQKRRNQASTRKLLKQLRGQ